MSRYDPFDPAELREPGPTSETGQEPKPDDSAPTVGRSGSSREEIGEPRVPPNRERHSRPRPRQKYRERGRAYHLRESEIRALADVGQFRAVRTRDLVEFRYGGDARQAEPDIRNLKAQGLLQQKTLPGSEKEPLLALTPEARRFLGHHPPEGIAKDQALYHGFVKPREARHDAGLYRLYQKAQSDIERSGGTKLRVVLDFELKRDLYRELAKLEYVPPERREEEKERIARSHGLTVVNGRIPLPDLRIEYETRDRRQARVDLELATADYRAAGIAEKTKAGFTIFAPKDEAARLRAAIRDPELTRGILSL